MKIGPRASPCIFPAAIRRLSRLPADSSFSQLDEIAVSRFASCRRAQKPPVTRAAPDGTGRSRHAAAPVGRTGPAVAFPPDPGDGAFPSAADAGKNVTVEGEVPTFAGVLRTISSRCRTGEGPTAPDRAGRPTPPVAMLGLRSSATAFETSQRTGSAAIGRRNFRNVQEPTKPPILRRLRHA